MLLAAPIRLLAALLTLALLHLGSQARAGIFVGNPVGLRVAGSSTLQLETGVAPLGVIRLQPCSGNPVDVQVDREVDLLGDTLTLPTGTWCGLLLLFDGELTLEGSRTGGGAVDIVLDAPQVPVAIDAPMVVSAQGDEAEIRLLPPGWFDEVIGAGSGPVTVEPGSQDHAELVALLVDESALLLQ